MDTGWPNPPVRFEDLHKVIELLGPAEGRRRLAGWVLVPGSWLDAEGRPRAPQEAFEPWNHLRTPTK